MENGDKTAERLEIAAVKEGNHTHAAVDIDCRASQIDCLAGGRLYTIIRRFSIVVAALLRGK
jgi:hypothetical protein